MSTDPVRVFSGLVPDRVTVAVTAGGTMVFAADGKGDESGVPFSAPKAGFRAIKNMDASVTIYFAELAADCTVAKGWPLAPGETFTFGGSGLVHVGPILAIVATGTASLAKIGY